MPNDFYSKQAELWNEVIKKNPKNAEAWLNVYFANRYANFGEGSPFFNKNKKDLLKEIETNMAKHLPEAFEYYL